MSFLWYNKYMLKYLVVLVLFLCPTNLLASRYDAAIKVASEAAFKQSGLESSFIQVKSTSNDKLKKFAHNNGLAVPATVIAYVVPIVYKKRIQFRMGNVKFKGTTGQSELTWTIQF